MGCGCGGAAGAKKPDAYEIRLNNGEVKEFTTEADARMALARSGVGGTGPWPKTN